MYTGLHVKYPLLLSHFNKNRIFYRCFGKNTQKSNSLKKRSVEAQCFPCGRTDMTKLVLAFRNFCKCASCGDREGPGKGTV